MSFLINPYAFLAAGGDFESIATVTVGSGGAANIEFTSIPGTYQHLQIRGLLRGNQAGTYYNNTALQFNSDTASNYAKHYLTGNGASASATGASSSSSIDYIYSAAALAGANTFFGVVIDVLDYASTAKYKTVRAFHGYDNNGSGGTDFQKGFVMVTSGLWQSTSAISSLKVGAAGVTLVEHTTLALYGIKA